MKYILWIHILFGTLALLSGSAAILFQKGSIRHIYSGRIFAFSMLLVAMAALVLHLPRGLFFLPAVGIFSFYLTFSGVRIFRIKRNGYKIIDTLMAVVCAVAGMMLIAISIYNYLHASNSMVIVTIAFGLACLFLSLADIIKIRNRRAISDARIAHLQRMGGAFISAITAVLVVNAGRIEWVQTHSFIWPVMWFLPSVIGSIIITRSIVKIKSGNGNK